MKKFRNYVLYLTISGRVTIGLLFAVLFIIGGFLLMYQQKEIAEVQAENVTAIKQYSTIPRPSDKDKNGPWALVVFNPTDSPIEVTAVNISPADGSQIFKQLAGGGNDQPTAGWTISGKNSIDWNGSVLIPAHSAQAFVVRVRSNKKDSTSVINTSVTITGQGTFTHNVYTSEQRNQDSSFASLWIDTDSDFANFEYIDAGGTGGEPDTYTVVLAETSNKGQINSGGTLTITIPAGFAGVSCIGGAGWDTPSQCDNTQIVVASNNTLKNSEIGFSFTAIPPSSSQELYNLHVEFDGLDDGGFIVAPRLNAGLQVAASPPSATWKTGEDTPIINVNKNENIRLRIEVTNSGSEAQAYDYLLEYASKAAFPTCADIPNGDFAAVPVTAGTEPFEMAESVYFANGGPTTARLTVPGSFTFITGRMVESPSNSSGNITLPFENYTEIEFVFQATNDAVGGGSYCFRATNSGAVLDEYSIYPELQIIP